MGTNTEMTGEAIRKRIAELQTELNAMPSPLESDEQLAREVAIDAELTALKDVTLREKARLNYWQRNRSR
jgi:hypothetical protein